MPRNITHEPARRVLMGNNEMEHPLPAPEVDSIGPFAMRSPMGINAAIRDDQVGRMGCLVEC